MGGADFRWSVAATCSTWVKSRRPVAEVAKASGAASAAFGDQQSRHNQRGPSGDWDHGGACDIIRHSGIPSLSWGYSSLALPVLEASTVRPPTAGAIGA